MPKSQAEREIEAALIRFAKSGLPNRSRVRTIPDFAGFEAWFFDRAGLGKTQVVNPTYRSVGPPQSDVQLLFAVTKIRKKYCDLVRRGKKKHVNKLKLMEHLYESFGERLQDMLRVLESGSISPEGLDEDLDSCSQNEIRARLFSAIASQKERTSFKLLGRLNSDAHDSGEVEYLEAMCHFKSGEFHDAAEWAKKVHKDDKDFGSATALRLESLAFLGDHEAVYRLLADKPNRLLCTTAFVVYVFAVLFSNTADVEKCLAAMLTEQYANMFRSEPQDQSVRLLHHYVVRLAMEVVEGFLQAGLVLDYDFSDARIPLRQRISKCFPEERALQMAAAIQLVPSLWSELSEEDVSEMYAPIVRHTHPADLETTLDDFKLALKVQYRLGARQHFIDNVLRALPVMETPNDAELRKLGFLAWQEALVSGDESKAKEIQRYISKWPEYESSRFLTDKNVEIERIRKGLTAAGPHFFDIAEMLCDDARQRGAKWSDAGLVSLAYFRLLENELNSKILTPLVKSISIDLMRSHIADLSKKHQQYWTRTLTQFEQISTGTRPGLELGALAILFSKLAKLEGSDASVKVHVKASLKGLMTPDGVEAINANSIGKFIARDIVDRFRNPPAHCRFVTLDTAEKSRAHVLDALSKLQQWVR